MSHDVLMHIVLPAWVALLMFSAVDFYRTECKKPVHRSSDAQATRNATRNTNSSK